MGAISSIHLGTTDYRDGNGTVDNASGISANEENSICRINISRPLSQNIGRLQLNHSFNVAESSSALRGSENDGIDQMGITIQYLAKENIKLFLKNKKMEGEIEKLNEQLKRDQHIGDCDVDTIYGEPQNQRMIRLEKHLASERQEKWSAIENSERTRVNLVNCERELVQSKEKIENLQKELEISKAHAKDLEETVNRLKEEEQRGETSHEGQSNERTSMKEFRADLKAKREARQRALSAISKEISSLRDDYQKEKTARLKLERELETRSKIASNPSVEGLMSDNAALRNEIDILTENIERLKSFSTENIRLKFEAKRLNEELDSMNESLGELKFEYYEEKKKHERTQKRLEECEERRKEIRSLNEWEEEKEKFFEKYDQEKEEIAKRTNALKEVIAITRQMLSIRESQVQELKNKIKDFEESVKKTRILEEDGLKAEYEKQLENIKKLKELYEERVRLLEVEKNRLNEIIEEKSKLVEDQKSEIKILTDEVEVARQLTKHEKEEKESMDRELRLSVAKCKDVENELNLMNNLFTQMLLGPYNTGNETDLDKLTELLQENHDLITEMTTREDFSEIASVLPKLLLDLITQVDNEKKEEDFSETCDTISEQSESLLKENKNAVLPILSYKNATVFKSKEIEAEPLMEKTKQVETIKGNENNSREVQEIASNLPKVKEIEAEPLMEEVQEIASNLPKVKEIEAEPLMEEAKQVETIKGNEYISREVQEIASNLPKVWKVLMELLSHHSAPEGPTPGDEKQCYKNVETPNGPRSVISVSKTFIRLKDLILEKKSLQKELTRLKQLNSHLESRLDDQEKRLSQVQCELHKTWGIVGRMRAQHQQLHNHEKILRYELQEKRVMLSELKQELEYCKEKWERARQKNIESETEWKKLRREFAARKNKNYLLSNLNDSGESGFSDEQNESGEDFDADRSNTQSPVDQKMLQEFKTVEESQENCSDKLEQRILLQSQNNLEQVTDNIEETYLEEITETTSTTIPVVVETTHLENKATCSVTELEESSTVTITKEKINEVNNIEKARQARDLRLKRLEEQCKLLVRQVDITTHKSNYLNNRLEELHEQYGSTEVSKRQVQTDAFSESQSNGECSNEQQERSSKSGFEQTKTQNKEKLKNTSEDDSKK